MQVSGRAVSSVCVSLSLFTPGITLLFFNIFFESKTTCVESGRLMLTLALLCVSGLANGEAKWRMWLAR